MSKRVVMIAAVARNGVIGNGPDIPWKLRGEQAEFKRLTMGHTLVMGRTTYDSIGRPLPGRTTIVLTRDPGWSAEGVLVAHSIEDALEQAARLPGDVVIAGGAQVYADAMPHATEQIVSEVDLDPDGDVFYPAYDTADWQETARDVGEGYERVFLERRST